ncbi:hypothetical protein KCP76_02870 [Salmonella enterica subsp. enterica serovar Weltevreden]|nr:hypothetical protein KCP76_02870 [Salmonella enterica subsp. enterica serovar Weltevreden]
MTFDKFREPVAAAIVRIEHDRGAPAPPHQHTLRTKFIKSVFVSSRARRISPRCSCVPGYYLRCGLYQYVL